MSRQAVNGWPADLATIARDIGSLLLMESGLMGVTALVAVVFQEWYSAGSFLLAGGFTGAAGFAARRRFEDAPPQR